MTLSPAVKLMLVSALGAGGIAVMNVLESAPVLSMASVKHAVLLGAGVAFTLFVKQETAALSSEAAPAPPKAP